MTPNPFPIRLSNKQYSVQPVLVNSDIHYKLTVDGKEITVYMGDDGFWTGDCDKELAGEIGEEIERVEG